MDDFNVNTTPTDNADIQEFDDMIIGDVENAKEASVLVPPTKRVKFFIKDIKIFSLDKNGNPRDWKFMSLELYIDEGIKVDGNVLYRNKSLWQNIPYFASPSKYDFVNNQFFANHSYLVPLKQLAKAFDLDPAKLSPKLIQETCIGKYVYADIVQQAETVKVPNDETGKLERVKTGDFLNEVKNFVKYEPELS